MTIPVYRLTDKINLTLSIHRYRRYIGSKLAIIDYIIFRFQFSTGASGVCNQFRIKLEDLKGFTRFKIRDSELE